jgi:hypothetical protein
MWNSIVGWVKSKNLSTHTFAIIFGVLVAAYPAVPAYKAFVNQIASKLPTIVDTGIVAAVGLIAFYKTSMSALAIVKAAPAAKAAIAQKP